MKHVLLSLVSAAALVAFGYSVGEEIQKRKNKKVINSLAEKLEVMKYLVENDKLIVNPSLKEEEA